MTYQIEYAYTCHIGKVRNNNEDNFWCCGKSLEAQNQGMDHIQTGCARQSELPLLAVFDGMGGESYGEIAAYLAAQACGEHYKNQRKQIRNAPQEFLNELCRKMNQAVCQFSVENKISSMGTTAALMIFGQNAVYSCNLGDSRIYMFCEDQFRRISTDHVLGGGLFNKSPLTQYLGIPEDYMGLEPSVSSREPVIGVRYLICSDGITDMLSDGEIADIFSREAPIEETAGMLLERALKKGGRDNITLVLCEVKEKPKNWFGRLSDWIHRKCEGDKIEKQNAGS